MKQLFMLTLVACSWLDESFAQRRQANQETRLRNERPTSNSRTKTSETSNRRSQRQSTSKNQGPVNLSEPERRQFQDNEYFDYDSIPQGPSRLEYDDDYYYDYDPLPAGPTREPPLPSGPTRRPDQPTRLPPAPQVGVARDVYKNLPLLTTRAPPSDSPRRNVNFRLPPPRNRGTEPLFDPPQQPTPHRGQNGRRGRPGGRGSGVFVTSNLSILDQTRMFSSMDPNQEKFIKAPRLNAGALPLAFEATDSNRQTFFPLPPLLDGP
jgi:hypothetical protein